MTRPRYQFSVRDRVLLVATIPILVVSLVLSVQMVRARLDDHVAALELHGRIIARNLALTSEFDLFSGNVEALEKRAESFTNAHRDIRHIEVLDGERNILVSRTISRASHPPAGWASRLLGGEGPFDFEEPVGESPATGDAFAEPAVLGSEGVRATGPLGWVRVHLDSSSLVAAQQRIIRQSLLLLMLGLGGSILLALAIGRTITRPVNRLLGAVDRLRRGDMTSRIPEHSAGEFGALERGFNAMAEDISSSQAKLRQQVDDATRELKYTIHELQGRNRELSEAQAEALAASRAKEEFLARMSHEIRTPLNAIIGFSRILGREGDTPNAHEHIHVINQASTQLLHVIDDILSFTRIVAGDVELEERPFDLTERMENLVAMVSHDAHASGLELVLLIHSDVPVHVWGDPVRLGQVVLNLLTNALKFTSEGHVFVEVSRDRGDGREGRILVSISDTGPGIPEHLVDGIFEPFNQGDNTLSRRHGGAGLGLAIARRLIESMGGEISVASEVAKGTRFRVSVPMNEVSGGIENRRPPSCRAGRALLYECHPLARRALRAMLSRMVQVACNTADFDVLVQRLEDSLRAGGGLDLLVVIGLPPGESAGDVPAVLYRRIRSLYEGPILFLVNGDDWQPGAWFEQADDVAWLSKPVRSTMLDSVVARLFGAEAAASPVPAAAPVALSATERVGRVLYVEDNAFNRELMGRLMSQRGIGMESAENGMAALEQVARNRYDAILMDLHLPGIDGRETARRIRERLGADCPPVIVLTADVFVVDAGDSPRGVFDDRLLKPVSDAELDRVIGRWMTGIAATEPPGGAASGVPASAAAQGTGENDDAMKARLHAETARLFALCREAWSGEDVERTRGLVHQLKGLAGMWGSGALLAAVRRLESQLDNPGDTTGVGATLDEIGHVLDRGP